METEKICESKTKVSAEKFFSAWKECAKKINESLARFYNKPYPIDIDFAIKSPHKTTFTNIVIDNDDSLVLKVAKELGLECYNGDYSYIDSVFYKTTDLISLPSGKKMEGIWLNTIRIAFEHEFDDVEYSLFTEIARLLTTNCELRVVVAYSSRLYEYDKTLYPSLKEGFDYFHEIISGCRDSQKISNEGSFLFILGHQLPKGANLTWQGFIYTKEKWVEL